MSDPPAPPYNPYSPPIGGDARRVPGENRYLTIQDAGAT